MDVLTSLLLSEIREPWPPLWVLESLAKVLLGIWLFFFGASVGSFLNVVVYRLPRGMSLVHPGSRCPSCGHAIRGRDNIPVVSWLALGGKCRDCRTSISPRYYYVELIVGLTFLLVAVFEAFLPRYLPHVPGEMGRRALSMQDAWPFWSAYATHVVLLTTLIGAALIDSDGFRVPRRLFVPVLVVGLIMPLLWPEMRRTTAGWGGSLAPWQEVLVNGVSGLLIGGLLGSIAGLGWWINDRRSWPRFAPEMSLASVGLVLGWQQTTVVALLSLTFFLLVVLAQRGFAATSVFPFAAAVFLVTAPLVVGLEWLGVAPVPIRAIHHPFRWLLFSACGVGFVSWGASRFAPAQYFSEPRRVTVLPDEIPSVLPEQAAEPASISSSTESPPT